jgi:hypothetical protein
MPPGVVAGDPAQQPHIDVLVPVKRDIVPAPVREGDLVAPLGRLSGQVLDEVTELALVEWPAGRRLELGGG